jgi:hypothetical protein
MKADQITNDVIVMFQMAHIDDLFLRFTARDQSQNQLQLLFSLPDPRLLVSTAGLYDFFILGPGYPSTSDNRVPRSCL